MDPKNLVKLGSKLYFKVLVNVLFLNVNENFFTSQKLIIKIFLRNINMAILFLF